MKYPEAFDLVVSLAEKHGRIPVGQLDMEPAAGWRLRVNGTKYTWGHIPPWQAMIERNGWPLMVVGPDGGNVIGHGAEEACIDMLKSAVGQQTEPPQETTT